MTTALQSYKKILEELDAGRLGASNGGVCVYKAKMDGIVRHCGVGALFSPAQIKSLKSRGLNDHPIVDVWNDIGEENLRAVTGMNLTELEELQSEHDSDDYFIRRDPSTCAFRKFIKNRIKLLS